MNRYLLQQKFFRIVDHFDVKDDRGRVRFVIKSKFFTIGKKFWINSPDGQEILYVKQRLFRLLPRFDLYQGDNYIGKIKRKLSLFVKRVKATGDFGEYTVKGNVFAWDFKVLDEGGNLVGNISKSVFRIADTYTVDAYTNDPVIMAIAVVMDGIFHPRH
ncbi:MAG: LURP-one-related family protein [Clostridia bacterium]|nr:LURP-one-related family protein [Clostridia bacterium]